MEFYMGRSLTNAMVNLGIDSPVEEALYEVRSLHMLEYLSIHILYEVCMNNIVWYMYA